MKKLISTIAILFSLSQTCFCQFQIDWQQCYGGSKNDIAYDIINSGNNYMIIGYTKSDDGDISFTHGEDDEWLIKTDSIGNLLWEKTYGGTDGEQAYTILKAGETTDVFLLGSSLSDDGDISYDPYPGSIDFWIVKIDSSGTIIWDRIVGGNRLDQLFTGTATTDGGLVAIGHTASDIGDITTYYGAYDMWLIKLDSEGNTEWDFSIGSSGFDFVEDIMQTSDGGFLVGGTSKVNNDGNILCVPYNNKAEAILFKLDANGNEEWQQCFGGSKDDLLQGLMEIDDGYVLVCQGLSNDGDLEGSGWHGGGDIWIIKTDFNGNIVWQKCYGGSNDEVAYEIFQTSDGELMIFGNTYSFDGDVVGNPSLDEYRSTIWIFKINSLGELIWQQCIGGIANERVQYGVVKKSDYNYVLAAEMTYSPSYDVDCSNHINNGYSDYWILEISDTTVNINEQVLNTLDLRVYPNPAKNYVIFELSDISNEYHINYFNNKQAPNIIVTNTFGQQISQLQIKSNKTVWDTRSINPGVYFYTFIVDGKSKSGKILISK